MNRMIFFNIGWMKHYQGLEGDSIEGGGSFVEEYDYPPCEVRNFQPYEGYMCGFVRVGGTIRIERLGASRRDESIDGVLVVWVAKSPSNGTVVIGWFEDATVYRCCQSPPEASGRKREGRKEWGYRVSAEEKNCRLLPPAHRTLVVPRGKGGIGQANLWYADKAANDAFRQKVRNFIDREQTSR